LASGEPDKGGVERARLDADTINNITQTVALILAGAWGVYTFIYQERIAPALAPPTLSVTSVLEKAGRHGNLTAIRCSVTRTNVGQSSVRILGLTYNVSGIKEQFLTGSAANPGFASPLGDAVSVNRARYQLKPARQEIILQNGTLTGYGVLRMCRTGYKIGPLFADSPETAERLFLALMKSKVVAAPASNLFWI